MNEISRLKSEHIIKDALSSARLFSERLNSIISSLVRLFRARGFRIDELNKVVDYISKQGDQLLSVAESHIHFIDDGTAVVYKSDIEAQRSMIREKTALIFRLLQNTSSLGEDLSEEVSNV